jgi:adenosylcobinamide-phosphate synthase
LAGVLDLRFGGPNMYGGHWVDKPFIGMNAREPGPNEIDTAVRINQRTCLLMILMIIAIQWTT